MSISHLYTAEFKKYEYPIRKKSFPEVADRFVESNLRLLCDMN